MDRRYRPRHEQLGMALSEREIEALAAYSRLGDQQAVATELEISIQTAKNHLSHAYAKLGAVSAIDALHKVGWLRIPGEADIAALAAESHRIEALGVLRTIGQTIGRTIEQAIA